MSDLLLGRAARPAAVSLGRSCAAVLDIRASSSNERLDPLAARRHLLSRREPRERELRLRGAFAVD